MSGGAGGLVRGRRVSAVLALVVLAGCGSTPPGAPTATATDRAAPGASGSPTATVTGTPTVTSTPTHVPTTTVPMTKPSNLESVLYRLVTADNRTAFANEHDLRTREGRVLVVIELEEDADLPGGYDLEVTAEYGTDVEAYVAIEDLPSLAGEGGVRLVRAPTAAEPQG